MGLEGRPSLSNVVTLKVNPRGSAAGPAPRGAAWLQCSDLHLCVSMNPLRIGVKHYGGNEPWRRPRPSSQEAHDLGRLST